MPGRRMGVMVAVMAAGCCSRAAAFELTSRAFAPGATVPIQHTCDWAEVGEADLTGRYGRS